MKYFFSILLSLLYITGFSQTETPNEDSIQIPQNIQIFKDPRLDILDTRPPLMAKIEAEEKAKIIPVYKPIVSMDGKKKVTGSIYTTKGFRIIIYNGPDRALAMKAKNNFSKAFADYRSYMSYNVPSYKIKVGDFEERKDASEFLRKVSRMFPSSFIVPDIITVKNINVSE